MGRSKSVKEKKEFYNNQLLEEIQTYLLSQKMSLAKEKIDSYMQKYPHEVGGKTMLLKYYNENKMYQEAYEFGIENNNVSSSNIKLYSCFINELARAMHGLELFDEEEVVLKEAICKTESACRSLVGSLAELYSQTHRYEEAVKLLNDSATIHTCDAYNVILTKIHFIHNEYEKAIEAGKRADDNRINNNQIQKKYYYIGKSYFELFNKTNNFDYLDYAVESFKKVRIQKNEYYYKAEYRLAYVYIMQNNLREAVKMLEDVIKSNFGDKRTYDLLTKVYGALNDDKKIDEFNQVIDPREIEYQRAKDCYLAKDFVGAAKLLEDYLNKYDKHTDELMYLLILSKFKLGLYKDALDLAYMYNPLNENYIKPLRRVKYFSKFMLNEDVGAEFYTTKQVKNYSVDEAIRHISLRHLGKEFGVFIKNSVFMELLQERLTFENLNPMDPFDRYDIKFSDLSDIMASYLPGKESLIVICIPNTKNILTTYISNKDIEDELDIQESDYKKTKNTLSRKQKFEQKYAKFL